MALFQQGMFTFDPKKDTPESVARKRALAAQIMGENGVAPQSTWDGVGNAFSSIMGGFAARKLNKQADTAEAAGRETASPIRDSIRAALMGEAAFPAAPGAPDIASQRVAQAHGGSSMPQTAQAGVIRQGLIDRGLPEHVADAFVVNFQDESGLNPGINEANPTVPGSRGGYGLYQLTGPRRVAYEKFAADRGIDPSDTNAQLDFLMLEGQGPEKAAFDKILAAPDTGTAASAIVNNFLRPAPEHRASRTNRYMAMGDGGQSSGQTASPFGQTPMDGPIPQARPEPVQVASLDPSIGMPQWSPFGGSMPQPSPVPDNVPSASGKGDRLAFAQPGVTPGAPGAESPAGQRVLGQMMNPQPMGGAPMPMQGMPQQTAQAAPPGPDMSQLPVMAGGSADAIQPSQQGQVPMEILYQALSNPFVDEGTKNFAMMMLKQQMAAQDPSNQLDMRYKQAQIDNLTSGVPSASSSFGNLDAQARAAGLSPGTPEYQNFMLNGGGEPATFRALDLQAKAAGFQPGTPEYNEFMGTRGAGLQAGAAQNAKNTADIQTGGAAEGAKDLGKASIKAGTDAWESYGKLQANLGNINDAIAAIDSGAKSGVIYKMLPNVTESSASLSNAMSRMGLDVVGSVTFGALSEGELNLAMNTAVPQDLGPAELKNWLVKKRDAQAKASTMLADAAQYLTVPGNTINGWIARNRATKGQGGAGGASTGAPASGGWQDAPGGVKIRVKQ